MANDESPPISLYNRDLSWLSFNDRVLQEARDRSVPLLDRLTFLGIVSSNLDEFFRVRVARLRTILRLKKKQRAKFGLAPKRLLREILARVEVQQEVLGQTLRSEILPSLMDEGICLVDEQTVSEGHHEALREYFVESVLPVLEVRELVDGLFLGDHCLYLTVGRMRGEEGGSGTDEIDWSLIEIPTNLLPRMRPLPATEPGQPHEVIFLDDIIRMHLPLIFDGETPAACFSVKLTRDAELYLEDELEGEVAEKVRRSLSKRITGVASRFLFDAEAPLAMVAALSDRLDLASEDLVAGGRYHNLADLMAFPDFNRLDLRSEKLPPVPHPALSTETSLFDVIARSDQLLELPYQSFESVLRFLDNAAEDPTVSAIWISLYRVADDSAVALALIKAAERGANVTAFVEVQARFDEATNLSWADRMEAAGVRVLTSREGLKVHAKIALVERDEAEGKRRYAYLGTGNFNENSARIYADLALFTARGEITREVRQVFDLLDGGDSEVVCESLLVAPAGMRSGLQQLVEREIDAAAAGEEARIFLKLNSLEDTAMIDLLYRAAEAGVEIDLVVRGICCLIPDQPGAEGRIRVRSIVDRFLEHARILWFHSGGDERVFVGSADWMTRNLDRRVEVVFPVLDPVLAERIRGIARLQLADNQRARIIDSNQVNTRVPTGDPPIRAQMEQYRRIAG